MISELIDKQALIADYRICGGCSEFENCNGYVTMCDSARIRQAINEAPTIEAEPVRHGRWIKIEPNGLQSRWKCSECDGIVHAVTDFCPYCGEKMYQDGGTISKERFMEIVSESNGCWMPCGMCANTECSKRDGGADNDSNV